MIARCPNCGTEQCWVKSDLRPRCPKCGWPNPWAKPYVVPKADPEQIEEPPIEVRPRRKRFHDKAFTEGEK